MRRERDLRYGSAGAIAADLRRFEADEPIGARAPSASYQLRKFVARHKGIVSAVGAVIVSLAIALIAALQDGRIAGAGLDVYEFEPDVPQALRDMENVTLLPHLGTATEEVRTDMGQMALDNVAAFVAGRPLPNPV